MSAEDLSRVDFIYGIFNRGGPLITAEFASPGSPGGVPVTYTDLMTATDKNGQPWSYLSSEAAYQYIREMHLKNLIVPLVGDFAGRTTIRMVSDYLKQRNATVAAFYISNVEMYLSGQGNYSRVGGAPVNVVVADKDITGLQLVLNPNRMSDKNQRDSPLVNSVLTLQNYLNELERVGPRSIPRI